MKRANVSLFAAFLAMALLSGMSVARAQDFYMDLHVGYNIVDNGDLEYGTGSFPTGYEQRSAVRSVTWIRAVFASRPRSPTGATISII